MVAEATSPCWQVKNILKYFGKEKSLLGQVNDLVFCVSFVLLRPVLLWFLWYNMVVRQFNVIIMANGLAVYVLGLVWSYTIICIIRVKILKFPVSSFENLRTKPFVSFGLIVLISLALPWAVGWRSNWSYIHIKVQDFTLI